MGKALHTLSEHESVNLTSSTVCLTEKGAEKAALVARKHAFLASFLFLTVLTDVLGKQPNAASKEACMLEHNISSETIEQRDSFLDQRKPIVADQPSGYINHNNHDNLTRKIQSSPFPITWKDYFCMSQ